MPEKSQTKKIFRLRPKAESDLENIYAYSYKEFGLSKAEQYIHDLSAAFQQLADDPDSGRDMSLIRKDVKVYPVNSHVFFFKPTSFGITIIRVLHKSMDYSSHL